MNPRSASVRRKSDLKLDIGVSGEGGFRPLARRRPGFSIAFQGITSRAGHGIGLRDRLMTARPWTASISRSFAAMASGRSSEVHQGSNPTTDATFRRRIEAGLETAKSISGRADRPGDLDDLETAITRRHVEAVRHSSRE